ncbi:hypothetical protein GLAREA_13004 [Glarea lozoyensis ATCC 20868]|uniref:Uncharacterized protein n=1 Tax=Glarea lozoyensis (strain ATCC 20868 / MF5171) TaxID=1116229 RepID=S3DEA8_GLAL2|nr:uncharacterized protein GLAREA_13004 [Glarea lozoyensis ATCC 20868]EPE30281.1 hypothetical protein GLAREA_13004 [Glarea lozoyensis ATCC 20868]
MNVIDDLPFIQPLAIRHDDESISAADWLSQITLCLAPLIIHVFVGIPTAVYLYRKEPRWHDQLGFYNPTTILWRYMAILDRRVRAKKWKSIDMGATNVRFWTQRGWDGSEEMMELSREFCTRIPQRSHVKLVSKTTVETVIIFMQGVQAAIDMVNGSSGGWTTSIATVFYPLTLFGLLRIPAAFWLSDEGTYTSVHSEETDPVFREHDEQLLIVERVMSDGNKSAIEMLSARKTGLTLHPIHTQRYQSHPRNHWRGRVVRGLYLVWLLFLAGLSLMFFFPRPTRRGTITYSLTSIIEIVVYAFLTLSSAAIFAFYNWRHNTSTTIIPCIQSLWYKIYTIVLFSLMLVLLVFAAIETHKEPCGLYSTTKRGFAQCEDGVYLFPYGQVGEKTNGDRVVWAQGAPGAMINQTTVSSQLFGGLYRGRSNENGTNMTMQPFVGWCKGNVLAEVDVYSSDAGVDNSTDWVRPFVENTNISVNITIPSKNFELGVPVDRGLELYGIQ